MCTYLLYLLFGITIPKMNKHLSTSIYAILRSLIGLMFRNGLSFGEFSELAKKAYVKEVEKELLKSGEKTTTSKIAIITGLNRKEVAAIRKEAPLNVGISRQHNRGVRVISGWLNDSSFCDKEGNTKILKINGKESSFEALVSKYSGDMPYRAMLNELIRTEAVEVIDETKVALIRSAYIPTDDKNEKYSILGEDVPLLISTINHNIVDENQDAFYQRKVCYDNVPAEDLEEFKKIVNQENQALLVKLNKWLSTHDMGKKKIKEPMKVGVGAYYFEETREAQEGSKNEN